MSTLESATNTLRAAAEPTRLRLLALCQQVDLTVSELTEILGQSQPRVSRHLKLLCDAGLLERTREGTSAFFRVAADGRGAETVGQLMRLVDDDDLTFRDDRTRLEKIRRTRSRAAADYFRDNANQWDRIRSLYVDEAEVENALLSLAPDTVIGDYLDIGTGTGRILEVLAPRVARGIGIDLSREMLAIARHRLEHEGLAHCRVRQGDMYRLPWPDKSFDCATFHQVLHYAAAPAAAIMEATRVLRPGGRMIVVDFAPHNLEFLRTEHAHVRLGLEKNELSAWFEAAGLKAAGFLTLPGDRLDVALWAADRISLETAKD